MSMLLLIATWVCGTLGFGLLAFSQKQHWALFHRAPSDQPPSWLSIAGWSLLGAAMLPAIGRDGIAFGLLCWCLLLPISAFTVAVLRIRSNSDRRHDEPK